MFAFFPSLQVSFLFLFFISISGIGWRAAIRPADHPVANFEFDVVVGADGRRNTLEGERVANKRAEPCEMPRGSSVLLSVTMTF